MQRLQKLNTQHLAAARLKAEGQSIAQISTALGVAHRTLHVWFSDELIKAEVRRLVDRITDVFVERKAQIGLRMLDELAEYATTPATKIRMTATCKTCGHTGSTTAPHGTSDPKCDGPWRVVETEYISESTKIEAIRELLDRVDDTTTLRDRAKATEALNSGGSADGEGGQTNNYLQIFQSMTDEDLAALMKMWAMNDGSANGNGSGPPALPA